jgi:hypothetical protein
MAREIFVNLPVKNMERSKAFFGALGFTFNPQFTNEQGACMVIAEGSIYAMLLVEPFFQTFTRKPLVDATAGTEVSLALAVDTRRQVDELADRALAAGGEPANETMEQGPMYGRSFQDPDGHQWEVFWMDPAAIGG